MTSLSYFLVHVSWYFPLSNLFITSIVFFVQILIFHILNKRNISSLGKMVLRKDVQNWGVLSLDRVFVY